MEKVRLKATGDPYRPSRGPSGTFMKLGFPTEQTSRSIGPILAHLYDAATEVPTVYIDEDLQTLTALYGETGLFVEFIVVEQALRVKPRNGQPHVLIAPSLREAMDFLSEIEGHRQMTCTPLMKHPNRHAIRSKPQTKRPGGRRTTTATA